MTTIVALLNAGTNLKPHSLNKSPDLGAQDTNVTDFVFNNDGSKMFVAGNENNSIYEYTLTTDYDVTTASYSNNSFLVDGQDIAPRGIAFNNNGTKMFVIGSQNNSIYEYTLTNGFSLATGNVNYSNNSFSVNTQDNSPQGIAFNNDGKKMIIIGNQNNKFFEYTLDNGFSLASSNVTYSNNSLHIYDTNSVQTGVQFNGDGTKIYQLGNYQDDEYVYEYNLGTAYDITSVTNVILDASIDFTLGANLTIPSGISLTIPSGRTLTIDDSQELTNEGILINIETL